MTQESFAAVLNAPPLESLLLLIAVQDSGSLGGAARQLGVSQPAASQRMAVLERRLELSLLERTPRGSKLTPDGTLLADWARQVAHQLEHLSRSAAALAGSHRAHLRLASSLTIAEHLLPTWLTKFREVAPSTAVGMQAANSAQVADLVATREVDLGFVETPRKDARLTYASIGRDRLSFVVPSSHPWATLTAVDPEQLSTQLMVVREAGSGTRDTVDREFCGLQVDEIEFPSNAAVRAAVYAGAGIGVISHLAVADDIAMGRLVEVRIKRLKLVRPLHAVWPAGERLVGNPAALLEMILKLSSRSARPR